MPDLIGEYYGTPIFAGRKFNGNKTSPNFKYTDQDGDSCRLLFFGSLPHHEEECIFITDERDNILMCLGKEDFKRFKKFVNFYLLGLIKED